MPRPEVAGVLTATELADTAASIAAMQRPSGAVPWPDGHVDPWDHVECAMGMLAGGLHEPAERAYAWLARRQRADGSWPASVREDTVLDAAAETNQCAYVAVGAWHHHLATGDRAWLERMWPVVRRALGFVLDLQAPGGEIWWARDADGCPQRMALLTGCSSTYQSLRCGLAAADVLGEPQPEWELAAGRLQHAIADHPEAFAAKDRWSMDWYYPVLGGAVRGARARSRIASRWSDFVVPGLGIRCVADQPWVTGAETCELVLALDAIGESDRAVEMFAAMQHLRHDDGSYWTGYVYPDATRWPVERSSWTAAAVVLAADALDGRSATSGLFRAVDLPTGALIGPVRCDEDDAPCRGNRLPDAVTDAV